MIRIARITDRLATAALVLAAGVGITLAAIQALHATVREQADLLEEQATSMRQLRSHLDELQSAGQPRASEEH